MAGAVDQAGYGSLEEAAQAGTAFVLLGHGTSHTAKISYNQMQEQLSQLGYQNVFVGTVEGEPEGTDCSLRHRCGGPGRIHPCGAAVP